MPIVFVVLIATLNNASIAQGSPPGTPTTYIGATDCGEWLKNPTPTKKAWLMGYLSGLNKMYSRYQDFPRDPLGALNTGEQAILWMDNFCRTNPIEMVSTGAMDLFIQLMSRK
jgi:hypothetical protein